jgi:hypothetical protein
MTTKVDMDEIEPIRKIIKGVSINTETAHCFHSLTKVLTEQVDKQVKHIYIVQGIYKSLEGRYFLAFWNRPIWNDESLSYDCVSDAILIDPEQARQWMSRYCPEKLQSFLVSTDKSANTQTTVSIRMSTALRDHIAFMAGDHSLNKICLKLINAGMSMNYASLDLSRPPPYLITMPKGMPAIDEFERALKFDDPDEQALAGYAELLYSLSRLDYPGFLPFVLKTLYRLIHINKNESHALCFVEWLSSFYRVGYNDSLEYNKRHPPTTNRPMNRWNTKMDDS